MLTEVEEAIVSAFRKHDGFSQWTDIAVTAAAEFLPLEEGWKFLKALNRMGTTRKVKHGGVSGTYSAVYFDRKERKYKLDEHGLVWYGKRPGAGRVE